MTTTTRRPGRPALPPDQRLGTATRIRVTRRERDLLAQAALQAGVPLATYIRHAALAVAEHAAA